MNPSKVDESSHPATNEAVANIFDSGALIQEPSFEPPEAHYPAENSTDSIHPNMTNVSSNEVASSAAVFRQYFSMFDQFVQENEGKEEFLKQTLSRYRPQLEEFKNFIDRVNVYKRRRLFPTTEELDELDPLLRFY